MNFYIPEIGDKIKLTKPWQFTLFYEHRNNQFIAAIRPDAPPPGTGYMADGRSVSATLPTNTVLRVDRIYVRKGKSDWSSVSFVVVEMPGSSAKHRGFSGKGRFWAKLEDCNEIEFSKVEAERE